MSIRGENTGETIYALSSAHGKAGISVIRVSGPAAFDSLQALCLKIDKQTLNPRHSIVRPLINPQTGQIIDQAMIIPFCAPHSFTGEDVVEYHCHGSRAVLEELFEVLSLQPTHRQALHGEFTRRAFENGRLDLTEAEAIADLIDAETAAQKDQALLQMGGALASLYSGWAEDLTRALAYIEAIIDFPDEDVPDEETQKALPEIQTILSAIRDHLNDHRRGERLRDGIDVVVVGAPNAGKSSLVNALAQRDVAIISDMAGTTRDILQVPLNLGGYPVLLSDTAGLRPEQISNQGQDKIEGEGIRRALKKAETADIRLLVFDASEAAPNLHTLSLIRPTDIVILNKSDLSGHGVPDLSLPTTVPVMPLSVHTGEGLGALLQGLTDKLKAQFERGQDKPSLTRARYRTLLEEAVTYLERSIKQPQPELMAQDIRFALTAIGRITGRVDVEDLLDIIFKDFCIGK